MKIGFIGCGNMGGALARAISRDRDNRILLADTDAVRLQTLALELRAEQSNSTEICAICDFIFLGVKPQGVFDLIEKTKSALLSNTKGCIVSMAAGVTTASINDALGGCYPIIRIMPNTPVAYGEGMTLASSTAEVSDSVFSQFMRIMLPTGKVEPIDEKLIDAASAVSGSGPAFVYLFIDAMTSGGESAGLSREQTKELVLRTIRGATRVAAESGKDTDSLCQAVCSPGGSTAEGVSILNSHGFKDTIVQAIMATYEKAKTLGQKKK